MRGSHFLTGIVCLLLVIQKCSCDELIAARVIHRHGDRNIYSIYPNDPHKSRRNWRGGLAALTDLGKRQTFKLGVFLRRRYHDLLGHKYSDNRMYYRSTDRSRTIKSAKSCAAALYPRSKASPKIRVEPIKDDYLLFHKAKCPRYKKLHDEVLESRRVVDIWKKHHKLIRYVEKHSGKRLRSLKDISDIYDTLYVEKLKSFRLPKWVNKAPKLFQTFKDFVGLYFESYAHTTEMKKFRAGYFIKKMLDHFHKKINSSLHPDRNLWIYSAHDITISVFLNALGLYDDKVPPYASSLHFELYKRGREYYVQIIYREPANNSNPHPLHIPKCGTKCPLDKFHDLYKHILPEKHFASACKM